jgi:hypothetical protein
MLGYGGPNDASANATFLFDDIKVVSNSLSTDLAASFNTAHLTAFPNPTKNLVTIHAKNTVINSIIVYNIVGKAVMSLFPSSDSATVDIAHLANGIYIAEILTASGKGNVKLLKE